YLTKPRLREFSDLLKVCSKNHVAYHVVEREELDRVTRSRHHEGVALWVEERPPPSLRSVLAQPGPAAILYLGGVQNPHNLGAIIRVCAHFGVQSILACGEELSISPALARTAEGGCEVVDIVPVSRGPHPLRQAREAGWSLLATSSHRGANLYAQPLPTRSVLLFGSEADGLPAPAQEFADHSLQIPGTGLVESLNVACATAVVLAEFWRTHT
ncbi:MAG: TrmH family RNA methyltransferase, partial [Nannocystaceae bacterium]